MANGSTKPGYAKADRFRMKRAHVQEEATEAIRRFRDSIDLEEDERPSVVVNLAPPAPGQRRSFSESLRPLVERARAAKTVLMVAGAAAGAIAGIVEALRQLGVFK